MDGQEKQNVYLIADGRRWVAPYLFSFSSHAKSRWHGQELVELYTREFKVFSRDYYLNAISEGRITVNYETVDISYKIGNGDLLTHATHLHEPSVLYKPIEIIENTTDYIVVDKPASMPTHKGGMYQYNSTLEVVLKLLNDQRTQKDEENINLFAVHRLDRVVSGILIFSKSKKFSKYFQQLLNENQVQKNYLARVYGKFPQKTTICKQSIGRNAGCKWKCVVDNEHGKLAETRFVFLSYSKDLDQSIVLCQPMTGRQHQLRVHLAHLGHPIVLDRVYAGAELCPEVPTTPLFPFPYEKDKLCSQCSMTEGQARAEHEEIIWDEIYLHAFSYYLEIQPNNLNITTDKYFQTLLPTWTQENSFMPPVIQSMHQLQQLNKIL